MTTIFKVFVYNAGDPVRSLGWEDPLEKGTATHSSILTMVYGVIKSWT